MEYNKKNILCFSLVCLVCEGNEICNFATTSFSLLLSMCVCIYMCVYLSLLIYQNITFGFTWLG